MTIQEMINKLNKLIEEGAKPSSKVYVAVYTGVYGQRKLHDPEITLEITLDGSQIIIEAGD